MTDQITPASPAAPLQLRRETTPGIWEMIQSLAPTIYTSRLFKVSSADQAAAVMLKGHELGLSLMASFEFIHEIKGAVGLSPRGALALILQSPLLAGIKITDVPDGCTVWMKRVNGFEYTASFTLEDAKRAGLLKDEGGWQKYPANMCRWRAIGFCADVVFPDVLAGMKTADQLGAQIDLVGNVIIEGQVS